jgi:outer membrane protein OmpA-like peptidoglycan-associated protein
MMSRIGSFFLIPLFFVLLMEGACPCYAETALSPLEFLRKQELRHRDSKGEVYLGKVMTLNYSAYATKAEKKVHPLLLELSDVLKTPLRNNYRLVLKGYSDSSGSPDMNLKLSLERAENLKRLLTENWLMKMNAERITVEAHGDADPVASNETAEGRGLNRRVEIHLYGDVSEAVRFVDDPKGER